MITLKNKDSKIQIDENGGRITSLILNAIMVLGTYERIDGKQASSHICTPNFSTEGMLEYGLLQHGSSRNMDWDTIENSKYAASIECNLPKTTRYLSRLTITQKFTLNQRSLVHAVQVKNMGTIAVPVNIGLHYYWDTPQGWENLQINDAFVSKNIRKDSFIHAADINTIQILGKPNITLQTQPSFFKLQLWTGRVIESNTTHFDTRYACIEPVYIDNAFSSIKTLLTESQVRKISVVIAV